MIRLASASTREHGFTLLEALVALVVISIGLLGVLGLQGVSVVNTQTSEARSLASIAADDIADRIRANPDGAARGRYNAIADPGNGVIPLGGCPDSCSSAQIAALDAWEWGFALHGNNKIRGTLPGAKGYVDCTAPATPTVANPCRTYTITIVWNERQAAAAGADNSSAGADFSSCDSTLHSNIGNQCYITRVQP